MNKEVISAAELRGRNDAGAVSAELEKTRSDKCFSYYTSEAAAVKILCPKDMEGKCCFFVSSIKVMNDPVESEDHNADSDRVHCLCFSHYAEEILPMWYLYGGISGKGARISFTPKRLRMLIDRIKAGTAAVYRVEGNNVDYQNPVSPEDFELSCGWVYYYNKGNERHIHYRDELYEIDDSENSAAEFNADNYFHKQKAWRYEKEFRIVFKFKDPVGDRIALVFDKAGLEEGLRVTLAPNFAEDVNDADELEKHAGKFSVKKTKLKVSGLRAQYDLIGRNKDSIAANFDALLTKFNDDDIAKIEQSLKKRKDKKTEK